MVTYGIWFIKGIIDEPLQNWGLSYSLISYKYNLKLALSIALRDWWVNSIVTIHFGFFFFKIPLNIFEAIEEKYIYISHTLFFLKIIYIFMFFKKNLEKNKQQKSCFKRGKGGQ